LSGTNQLFIFGGNANAGLLSDIWFWNFTRWVRIAGCSGPTCRNFSTKFPTSTAAGYPGARAYSSSWVDGSGNMMLFGGYGYDTNGNLGELNDLWIMKPGPLCVGCGGGGGNWSFVGGNKSRNAASVVSGLNPWPSGRDSSVGWLDSNGYYYLFGGYSGGSLSDMWRVSPGCPTCNFSRVVAPISAVTPAPWPSARFGATGWTDSSAQHWMFGGYDDTGFLNDLWHWNRTSMWQQTTSGGPLVSGSSWPSPRYYSVGWANSGNGNFYLFSGYGTYSGENGVFNDLWSLTYN